MAGLALRCIFWEKFPRVNAGLSTPHVFKYWELMGNEWLMTSFVKKKKTHQKDVVGIVTFDLTGLLPSNHIIAYITMAYRSLWRNLWRNLLTVKKLKQHKVFEKISLSESWFYKRWQTSAIIQEISDSNLETGRNGSKSAVSWIIRESW